MKRLLFISTVVLMGIAAVSCTKERIKYAEDGETPLPKAVDLGLSVKWATCNLGASRPEEQGDVFTLGETAPIPDDMAHLGWGGRWRMPTSAEFYELCINCAWEWTARDSVQGYKVTSKIPGYTDRSIFLPVADGYSGLLPFYTGPRGEYWSSTVITDNPDYTFILYFDSGNVDVRAYNRKFSRSLRPVTP